MSNSQKPKGFAGIPQEIREAVEKAGQGELITKYESAMRLAAQQFLSPRTIEYSFDVFDQDGIIIDQGISFSDTKQGEDDFDAWARFVGSNTTHYLLSDFCPTKNLSVRVVIKFLSWEYVMEQPACPPWAKGDYPKDWSPSLYPKFKADSNIQENAKL